MEVMVNQEPVDALADRPQISSRTARTAYMRTPQRPDPRQKIAIQATIGGKIMGAKTSQ